MFGLGAGIIAGGVLIGLQQEPSQCESTAERMQGLAARLDELEAKAAGQTSAAFVFIKPHAVTDKTAELVKSRFAECGIRVTGEGKLDHKTIDEQLLIDTHYGAIANRAVKQKPAELVVQDSAKAKFKEAFGLTWDNALSQGLVYNAADACKKLGLDGASLETEWRKAKFVKFGGGFYCGKMGDIFVMNGFYMAMRSQFTTPPACIHYFTVEWPNSNLSWEDFRGKVLGATDPTKAEKGSVRQMIYEKWESLGLPGQPSTGHNGVHASASPFEALAERANWLKVPIAEDTYGKGLIAAGVSEKTLMEWSGDPSVSYEGKIQSLFDLLEDLDADACLMKAKDIVGGD
jgi:nucleoside diphosphate kinase